MAKSLEEIEADFRARHRLKETADSIETVNDKQIPRTDDSHHGKSQGARAALLSDIIFYTALIAMVICAVVFSRGAFGSKTFGGYRFYEVLSTSMESVYPRGSLVCVKETAASELMVGDDITFAKDSSNLITHRIIEIQEDYQGSGKRAFVTKGTDNAAADTGVVMDSSIIGKVQIGIPGLGALLSWLGGNLWLLLLAFLSLMACSFFLKIFFRESKREKTRRKMKSLGF